MKKSVFRSAQPSLILCIMMDAIGYFSYSIPLLGEFADLLWAPLSALVFYKMFSGWKGAFGGVFNFIEEILPGLDFIPTFTIAWLIKNFYNKKMEKSTVHAANRFNYLLLKNPKAAKE